MSERIKVMHVIHDLGFGGAQRVLANLVLGRHADRFDATVVSLYAACGGVDQRALEAAGIQVHFLDKKPGFDFQALKKLGRVIREWKPDLVHTHGYVLRYAWPFRALGMVPRMVHTVHNVTEQDSGKPYWMTGLCYRLGVNTVAVGGVVAESVKRLHGVSVRQVIFNGIEVEKYRVALARRAALRLSWGAKDGDVVFVCVASLTQKKNHPLLLAAFASLQEAVPDTQLILVGDGDQRAALETEIEGRGLSGQVRLLGNRDDVADVLSAADVFVLSSDKEGMPLSAMEAMAAGKPVVATRVGGTPEVVRDFVDGVLVEVGDAEGLAEAMRCLAADRARRSVMGAAALRRAEAEFGVRRMIDQYEAFYERVVARHQGVGR